MADLNEPRGDGAAPIDVPAPQKAGKFWRSPLLGVVLLVVGLLGWGLVDAVRAARESARMSSCLCTFCHATLAFHNYHDEHGALPAAASTDSAGKPLLSWRLTMMGYLDGNDVLAAATPSAPWDDPANAPLLSRRPRMWGCPSHPDFESEYAHKAAVTGPDTAFPKDRRISFEDVTDGLGATLCVAEIRHRVPWTKPEDVDGPTHPAIGMPGGFDSYHPAGINVGFLDGSHRTLSRNIDPEILKRMILRNDGQSQSVMDYLERRD